MGEVRIDNRDHLADAHVHLRGRAIVRLEVGHYRGLLEMLAGQVLAGEYPGSIVRTGLRMGAAEANTIALQRILGMLLGSFDLLGEGGVLVRNLLEDLLLERPVQKVEHLGDGGRTAGARHSLLELQLGVGAQRLLDQHQHLGEDGEDLFAVGLALFVQRLGEDALHAQGAKDRADKVAELKAAIVARGLTPEAQLADQNARIAHLEQQLAAALAAPAPAPAAAPAV